MMDQQRSAVNRRNMLKALGGVGIGGIGAKSLLDEAIGTAQASPDPCPRNATRCTGGFNKDTVNLGRADGRYTQSLAIIYWGPDGVDDQHSEAQDAYLHQFHIFGHASMRKRFHKKNAKWKRSDDLQLSKIGYRVDGIDPVNPIGAHPQKATGAPPGGGEVVISTGVSLSNLIIGYYYPAVGIGMTVTQLAAALYGAATDDPPPGPTEMEETWGHKPASDLAHYVSFQMEVPDQPGKQSSVTIETFSEGTGGSRLKYTEYDFIVQNPGNPNLK
jgi:hypothetical protein